MHWNMAPWLAGLFNEITEEDEVPEDWTHSVTVPIYKKKGALLNAPAIDRIVCSVMQ